MNSLADSELRTVIEDARTRHAAVVGLMYATDAQAIGLLRSYVTIGIAAASGTAAGFGPSPVFDRPVAWAMLAATILVLIGAVFCLRCLRPTAVNLPGRDPDFWQWATLPNVERAQMLAAYLDNLKTKGADNFKRNARAATELKWAKRCGLVAIGLPLLVGFAAAYWHF